MNNRAKDIYLNLLLSDDFQAQDIPKDTSLFLSIVYINLQQYTDAEETALSVVDDESSELRTRILLTIAQKTRDESKVSKYRQLLSETTSKEDLLATAAVDFAFRRKYEDVIDTYKHILAGGNADDLALYAYTAMALFKLGHYEEALEALDVYCNANPDSIIAANIKACCLFNLC